MQSWWFDFDFKDVFHFALDSGKPRLFHARAVDPETLITVDSSPLIVFLSNKVLCVLVITTEFADSCKQLSWSSLRERIMIHLPSIHP
jgi:hypothetical protein